MSEIFANLRAYRGWKVTSSVFLRDIRSYRKNIKIRALNSSVLNQQLHICRTTLKHPKWVKLDTLLKITERKTKRKLSCCSKDSKEKQKIKSIGLPPKKLFLYSHIARLLYFILKRGICCMTKYAWAFCIWLNYRN